MCILSFNPEYRRIWMFPRNIRYIAPWKIYGILKVLMQCDEDNTDEKVMYKLLSETGIKRKENIIDKNDGGMRTYFAQLEMLGLVYESEYKGKYHYTIAGEAIADEDNPLQVLQYQLLRHQYPSAYGLSSNVKMDPRMKVKPFLFLLRLLHEDRLDRQISIEETILPVIYGHNDDCYEFVIGKIIESRNSKDGLKKVIINPYFDMYTRRGNPSNAFRNMRDIANTALNYLEATQLVVKTRHNNQSYYLFNENYEDLYQKAMLEADTYLSISKKSEIQAFQRSYGRYLENEDSRDDTCIQERKESPLLQFVTYKYIEYLNNHLFAEDTTEFVREMAKVGVQFKDSVAAIDKLQNKRFQLWRNTYLDYAFSGGLYADQFEQATTELLESMGFGTPKWTSKTKSENSDAKLSDAFLIKSASSDCGLADTVATSSFRLGYSDIYQMKKLYIQTKTQLPKATTMQYILYIAGGFKNNIDDSLIKLSKVTGLPVSALDAKGLLKLREKKIETCIIESRFFKSGRYVSSDEIEIMSE